MNRFEVEISEKINLLREQVAAFNPADARERQLLAAEEWLVQHPRETIESIHKLQLTKYDCHIVGLIERIGSPLADICARQLIELLLDMNWPVYQSALSALFSLDEQAVLNAAEDLVNDECFKDLDVFCYHVLQIRPPWMQKVKPCLTEAMHKVLEYANNSALSELNQELDPS
ncbi:hypothetical protein [Gimesia sp.]|uniref:hypothetical protein n=1 Tax=Gimesia sp. TaxID=2024833 RepID=UPI003A9081B7